MTLLNTHEVAALVGVSTNYFRSVSSNIKFPDPVIKHHRIKGKRNGSQPSMYDEDAVRKWIAENDFWMLATEFRYRQRYGNLPRKKTLSKRTVTKPYKKKKVPKEIADREAAVRLRPELKDFMLGKLNPKISKQHAELKQKACRKNNEQRTG